VVAHAGDSCGPWQARVLKGNWPMANQVMVAAAGDDGRLDIVTAAATHRSNEVR
jgi:hypothetical protein